MNKFNKIALGLAAVALSMSASAVTISLSNDAALDGSGLTSQFIDPTQAAGANPLLGVNGYFIETFDKATSMGGLIGSTAFNAGNAASSGCAVNSTGSGITVTPGTGTFQVRGDDNSAASAPALDDTCFGYTPAVGGALGSIEIDYSAILGGTKVDYFGFYWGSVDNFNTFTFFDGATQVAEITGPELLALTGGTPGNQSDADSNVYVNFDFDALENFTKLVITSTGVAGEVDNMVIGLSTRVIPEPATLAVFGLGLLGLAGIRRKKF